MQEAWCAGCGGPFTKIFLSEFKPEDALGSEPVLTVLLGSVSHQEEKDSYGQCEKWELARLGLMREVLEETDSRS